ncbi:MAG: NAD(P)H-dependent oxidoreductase subunit E [Anaerolineales bacterium]|jgi:NADH:ubiquinone oxidoreductase subunit E|nr:NAD(P)H-dependent oxidoreductase subunit E [Anaerolineales bacterium]
MTAPVKEHDIPALVRTAIEKHGGKQDALIPILSEINAVLGYIPGEAFHQVSKQLQDDPTEGVFVAESQLHALASFYDMLSTKARGAHVIKFCENAPCHVVGGKAVWDALREQLSLKNGETSPDNKWTLVTTSCLGLCSVGPVVLVDDDIYGNVTPEQVPNILGRYE